MSSRTQQPCSQFAQGKCKYGQKCRFSHEISGSSTKTQSDKQPCKFFLSAKGCKLGERCNHSHERNSTDHLPNGKAAQSENAGKEDTGVTSQASAMRIELREWRRMIPKAPQAANPLAHKLSRFANNALLLVKSSAETRQEVIKDLASEGGLHRVKELIGPEWDGMSEKQQQSYLNSVIVPFFKIISDADVLASYVVEHAVNQIYLYLFGVGGKRTLELFGTVVKVLSSVVEQLTKSEFALMDAADAVEAVLAVLAKIVDLNGATQSMNNEFHPLVENLSALVAADYLQSQRSLVRARACLQRLQRRFDSVADIPLAEGPSKTVRKDDGKKATFVIEIDRPGALSPKGPRHDNDYARITDIKILPTTQETMSERSEYWPLLDPSTHHITGTQGLYDRQFRLLRADTVGQLTDAVRDELNNLRAPKDAKGSKSGSKRGARTNVYRNAVLTRFKFDQFRGLEFEVEFDQPEFLRTRTLADRKEYWENSKRLAKDALVCLLGPSDSITFCAVSEQSRPSDHTTRVVQKMERPPSPADENETDNESLDVVGDNTISRVEVEEIDDTSKANPEKSKSQNLVSRPDRASVVLTMVERNEDLLNLVLERYIRPHEFRSECLIEFPGVLLPSFRPVLEALQIMADEDDLPFAHLLAPSDPGNADQPRVLPPAYARRRGFCFDLDSITKKGDTLTHSPSDPVDIRALHESSGLDVGQATALVDALSRELALIQGPPGTGKSYTGVALIKVLLGNRSKAKLGPLVCVCYTNHALDQLLEHLVDSGITQIIRIGSQSKSEKLQNLNLRNVLLKERMTREEGNSRYRLKQELKHTVDSLTNLLESLGRLDAWTTLRDFLQDEYPQHCFELSGGEDEDGWEVVRRRPEQVILDWLNGRDMESAPRDSTSNRPLAELFQLKLFDMSLEERATLHAYWTAESRSRLQDKITSAIEVHAEVKQKLDDINHEVSLRCLEQAHVIGVTTSGLAGHLKLLRRLQSKVVVCEEAGEVLESHLLCALLHAEHAILIGDHLQLRPQINNYQLSSNNPHGKKYSLDISLFERLVTANGSSGVTLPYSVLDVQRRMHPLISQLLRDTLYSNLRDSPAVMNYPEVSGIKKRLFWLDHRVPEAGSVVSQAVSTSHTNDFEVEMAAALVSHLIKQSTYEKGDIAILTPYLGQLHNIRRKLGSSYEIVLDDRDATQLELHGVEVSDVLRTSAISRTTALKALKVATIDNFQGEEAKVVVISLVRSNKEKNCGFLSTFNRINVLLSRAKHGMFIIGNAETSAHVPMWGNIVDILRAKEHIGPSLSLVCPRHPRTGIEVSSPEDFQMKSPEGGCSERCIQRLKCGHSCVRSCHSDVLHRAVRCLEPCPRPKSGCDHQCDRACGDPCDPNCKVKVENVTLPCGHRPESLECWKAQNPSTKYCKEEYERIVPGCNHVVKIRCVDNVDASDFACHAECGSLLLCGHLCKRICKDCKTRTGDSISQEDHGSCTQVCGRDYTTCSHRCEQPCHGIDPCKLCGASCEARCSHSECSKKCHEPCSPCANATCDVGCRHANARCHAPCAVPCDWIPCSRRCERPLWCGHRCPSMCGEVCPKPMFCQICASDQVKDTTVDFILGELYKDINLDQDPVIVPPCGHIITVGSLDGYMSMHDHYVFSPQGSIIGLKKSSSPFDVKEMKSCPTCRGSLKSINRYGRIIRRALLDESTKKFIVWANRQYVAFAKRLEEEETNLASRPIPNNRTSISLAAPVTLVAHRGRRLHAVQEAGGFRFQSLLWLFREIYEYQCRVMHDEQPFQQVFNTVQDIRRRKQIFNDFTFDDTVLQTRSYLLATVLVLRCDFAVLSHFLLLRRNVAGSASSGVIIDLSDNRKECTELIAAAVRSQQPMQEVEGRLYFARFSALERSASTPERSEALKQEALRHLEDARVLCQQYPGQTRGLATEVDDVKKMLADATFYATVTNEERRQILAAMATEFTGTGHWYYCRNGHPFTVGECGGPMQESVCPQCQAPVGGRNHEAAEGVTHARDLEQMFEDMRF